jgi:hypothetical protein
VLGALRVDDGDRPLVPLAVVDVERTVSVPAVDVLAGSRRILREHHGDREALRPGTGRRHPGCLREMPGSGHAASVDNPEFLTATAGAL